MAIVNIVFFLAAVAVLILPVCLGLYVYQDAKHRGMNAILWTLVSILTPTFIGVIIYLLVRSSYSDLKCPNCLQPVNEQFTACPNCGTKLRETCPACGFPVESDWNICPRCTTELPKNRENVAFPIQKKDRFLKKIAIIVLTIPMLLILFVIFGLTMFQSVSSTLGTTYLTVAEASTNDATKSWITQCDRDPSKIYALKYTVDVEDETETSYLIYLPSNGADFATTDITSWFKTYIKVSMDDLSDVDDSCQLVYVSYTGNDPVGLKILHNDEKADYELTDINYDPDPMIDSLE